jgi:excisionase family DNA binding protein
MENNSKSMAKRMRPKLRDLKSRISFTDIKDKEIMPLEEACVFINMEPAYMYQLIFKKTIPYHKPGGRLVYFERNDLLAFLKSNKTEGKA